MKAVVVLCQSCPRDSDVPCKLNNEKHEQTPWTILIEKQSCSEMSM